MPAADYKPSVNDVGAMLRARTMDDDGNEIGTFDSSSRPTDVQVTSLIQDAVSEAYLAFGDDIPDNPGDITRPGYDVDALRIAAKNVVKMRAAALVEISFFPEQVARGNSPYQQYQDSWEKGLVRVAKAISEVESGDEPGEDTSSNIALSDGFPTDAGGMVGWGTRW